MKAASQGLNIVKIKDVKYNNLCYLAFILPVHAINLQNNKNHCSRTRLKDYKQCFQVQRWFYDLFIN